MTRRQRKIARKLKHHSKVYVCSKCGYVGPHSQHKRATGCNYLAF